MLLQTTYSIDRLNNEQCVFNMHCLGMFEQSVFCNTTKQTGDCMNVLLAHVKPRISPAGHWYRVQHWSSDMCAQLYTALIYK